MVQLPALGTYLDLLGVFQQCRRLAFIYGQASGVGDITLSSWNRSLGAILALVGRRGMRARASLGGIRGSHLRAPLPKQMVPVGLQVGFPYAGEAEIFYILCGGA